MHVRTPEAAFIYLVSYFIIRIVHVVQKRKKKLSYSVQTGLKTKK